MRRPVFPSGLARTLIAISFLLTFAESMLIPIYAAFTEKVGGSILDAGIAFSVFSIATGVFILLVGTREWFQAHIKQALIVGLFLSALCDFAFALVANRWQLFGVQLFAGLATGIIEPSWDSLFTDEVERSPARQWSFWAGGVHVATGVAAVVGGLVAAYASFTVLFVAMGTIDLLAALSWLRAERTETVPHSAVP